MKRLIAGSFFAILFFVSGTLMALSYYRLGSNWLIHDFISNGRSTVHWTQTSHGYFHYGVITTTQLDYPGLLGVYFSDSFALPDDFGFAKRYKQKGLISAFFSSNRDTPKEIESPRIYNQVFYSIHASLPLLVFGTLAFLFLKPRRNVAPEINPSA